MKAVRYHSYGDSDVLVRSGGAGLLTNLLQHLIDFLECLAGDRKTLIYLPAHPDGLRPPSQLRFVFRQERRLQVAWAFPTPNEQVALHA